MSVRGTRPDPPRWAARLLAVLLPSRLREEHLGDLHEGYLRRATVDAGSARRWYVAQVLRSIPGALRLRYRSWPHSPAGAHLDAASQDIRYGIRALWKSPGFALVSITTLALAIGVNTSIFSLISAVVFADLPMRDPASVALIRGTNAELGIDQGSVSPADYMDLVDRTRSFTSLSALTEAQWVLTGEAAPERVQGIQISAGLNETWQLPPVIGRAFADGEDRWGAPPVAMLTYGYWQERYGGRTDVLGETLRLDGLEHTIVGVTDPRLEFGSLRAAKVAVPLILNRGQPNRSTRYLTVTGRLADGTSHEVATAEVRSIGENLAREHPVEDTGWGLWSAPVRESLIDDNGDTLMLFLQLTVAMVILIACANVANMLLARATARAREMAVRSALGASRGRVVRQLLTESLMISVAATGLGVATAFALNRALIWISAGQEPVFLMAELNGRVLAFTLAICLLAPVTFGLFPALRASAGGPEAALRDGRSGDGGLRGKRARSALVTAQVALALTLMVVATLLTRSVINLSARPLGFDAAGILTLRIDLPETTDAEPEAQRAFFVRTREAVSGAVSARDLALVDALPGVDAGRRRSFLVEGREVVEGRAQPTGLIVTASADYFDLLGLRVERGRGFTASDDATSFPVTVISRAIADRYWPKQNPVGDRIQVSGREDWVQVVGVVSDVRNQADTDRGAPNLYLPFNQEARAGMYVLARTDVEAGAAAGPLRQAVRGVDPAQPVDRVRTLPRALYEAGASTYALLSLFVTFALFALLMAAVGIYGVMAYSVSQRQNEIGLRMALGAEGGRVRWMIVTQGVRLVALGVGLGLLVAFALSRLLGNLVFGISTNDPLTFVGMPAVLIVVALVANVMPARRATRLDPARTLRAD
jgi:putative ABC transport system permease protein